VSIARSIILGGVGNSRTSRPISVNDVGPAKKGVCKDHKSKAPSECCREAVREAAQAHCQKDR
jgi:hypothetical protein